MAAPRNRAKKTGKKKVPIEDIECILFAKWLDEQGLPHTHIPNESRSSSKNAIVRAKKLKSMGVTKGVWDYEVFVPVYDIDDEIAEYQILKIEMKRQRGGGSVVSKEQKEWKKIYEMAGIPCAICYGAEQAKAFVTGFCTKLLLEKAAMKDEMF